jgi:hypothetical protein
MIRLHSRPLTPISHQQIISLSQSSCVSSVQLTDGRRGEGAGVKPHHTAALCPCKKPVKKCAGFLVFRLSRLIVGSAYGFWTKDGSSYSLIPLFVGLVGFSGWEIHSVEMGYSTRQDYSISKSVSPIFGHPIVHFKKVHKHEIFLNFFYLNQILICPW